MTPSITETNEPLLHVAAKKKEELLSFLKTRK
jgi:hypothetical protein